MISDTCSTSQRRSSIRTYNSVLRCPCNSLATRARIEVPHVDTTLPRSRHEAWLVRLATPWPRLAVFKKLFPFRSRGAAARAFARDGTQYTWERRCTTMPLIPDEARSRVASTAQVPRRTCELVLVTEAIDTDPPRRRGVCGDGRADVVSHPEAANVLRSNQHSNRTL